MSVRVVWMTAQSRRRARGRGGPGRGPAGARPAGLLRAGRGVPDGDRALPAAAGADEPHPSAVPGDARPLGALAALGEGSERRAAARLGHALAAAQAPGVGGLPDEAPLAVRRAAARGGADA